MGRRRGGESPVENVKKKEEEEEIIDAYRTVYVDTNLDTHLALVVSQFDSVLDIKQKVMLEHVQCFPKLGEIIIHALKVKRKGHFYHLSDSMRVNRAFEGIKNSWFLSVDASYLKQHSENEKSCRPNTSNQSPVLCLTYNLANTECNNDDASTSAILKSASVERLRNHKVQPILGDSCREFNEDIVTNHECSGTEILKKLSADVNRVPDLPTTGTRASNIQCSNSVEPSPETGLPKKKKQKIKEQNVEETEDCLAKVNIALNHVSGGEALHCENLLSANMLVCAEKAESKEGDALLENRGLVSNLSQKTSKQETILPKDQYNSQIIASNTVSSESTDADQMTLDLRIENMKSKKGKRHEMNLSSADNLVSNPSQKTSKQETILPKDQYNSQIIASNIVSSESTDADQTPLGLRIENMKSKKKRKRHEMNLSRGDNHETVSFSLSVKDSAIKDGLMEKNISSNHVNGEVLSPPEIIVPLNFLVNTERKEHKEIGDALKENKIPVSTSKEDIEMPRNSEEQNNSPKIVLDTLSSEPADIQHLRTSPGITNKRGEKKRKKDVKRKNSEEQNNSPKTVSETLSPEPADIQHSRNSPGIANKRGKKKRKKDVKRKKDATSNLPSDVLPSSVQDAGGEDSFQEKNIASNHVSGEDESQHVVAVPMNLIASAERTEHEGTSGDTLKEDKILVSTNETSKPEIGLTENSMEDRHNSQKIVVDTLSSAAAEYENLRTGTDFKCKKNKKKRKKDAMINISNSTVVPSSAKDAGETESLNDKKSALNSVSAEDEAHPESAALANLLVDGERTESEKIRDSLEQDKKSVPSKKTSKRGTELNGNTVEDRRIVVSGTLSPEPAENEHLTTNSSIKRNKSKKKKKRDTTLSLSSAIVLPSSAQDAVEEESCKEKNIVKNNESGKDKSHPKIAVPGNFLVDSKKTKHKEFSGDHLEQNKGLGSQHKNTSTQEIGLKLNSVQDQNDSQKVVLDTLSPVLADSEQLETYSDVKKMKKKKKKKMKMDATFTSSGTNVLPSSVQDPAGVENLKEERVPLHEEQSHHETAIPANFLVNIAERSEHEEITRDPLEKDKVGVNATNTSIGFNLDNNTARISKNDDIVDVQSANIITDKARKDQTNLNTSQPAVSESKSDRIDFKHYFLPGTAEDKVAGSDKNGITRSDRDDKTKESTKKLTASLIASHDQALTLQSSKNQEGGVKSHHKCSSDIDPQESFSKDASSGSSRPSKKSASHVYQKELPSSFEPDQAKTPHSVLRASDRGVSASNTPSPAYRKRKQISSAASSSSSESFDKSHQGTKSKNRVSNADRRLVACSKGSAKGTSEVKNRPFHRKSLLTSTGSIFKDDSSDSSDDERGSEQYNSARNPSDDVLSSDSDRDSDTSLDSPKKGSTGLDKKEGVENTEKRSSSDLRNTTIDMILRSSSRYKKAKLTAESQPEVEDSESQPVDCVPDSQANP